MSSFPWLWGLGHVSQSVMPSPFYPGVVAHALNNLSVAHGRSSAQYAQAGGCLPRFVAFHESLRALEYESRVSTGEIPTRDLLHDWYNGLVWVAYPKTKCAINRIHMQQALLSEGGQTNRQSNQLGNGRTRRRDAVTLFDESGALLITTQASLSSALSNFDWTSLFLEQRQLWRNQARLVLLGHGLLESLHNPHKSLCAKVLPIVVSQADWQAWMPDVIDSHAIDAVLAKLVSEVPSPSALLPLPVMGVPGWFSVSDNPGFYADGAVFRSKPTHRK